MQRLRSQWTVLAELKKGWSAYSGKGKNGLALDR